MLAHLYVNAVKKHGHSRGYWLFSDERASKLHKSFLVNYHNTALSTLHYFLDEVVDPTMEVKSVQEKVDTYITLCVSPFLHRPGRQLTEDEKIIRELFNLGLPFSTPA